MGRDHSAPCDVCGELRGGFNDLPCKCDVDRVCDDLDKTLAGQLQNALAERDTANATFDELTRQLYCATLINPENPPSLASYIRERYARERDQWKANHDQRKQERDAALEKVETYKNSIKHLQNVITTTRDMLGCKFGQDIREVIGDLQLEVLRLENANASLVPNAILATTEVECMRVELAAAREEIKQHAEYKERIENLQVANLRLKMGAPISCVTCEDTFVPMGREIERMVPVYTAVKDWIAAEEAEASDIWKKLDAMRDAFADAEAGKPRPLTDEEFEELFKNTGQG